MSPSVRTTIDPRRGLHWRVGTAPGRLAFRARGSQSRGVTAMRVVATVLAGFFLAFTIFGLTAFAGGVGWGLLIFLLPLGMVGGGLAVMIRLLGAVTGYPEHLTVDGARGEIRQRVRGRWLWGSDTDRVRLADLDELRLRLETPGDGPPELALEAHGTGVGGWLTRTLDLPVISTAMPIEERYDEPVEFEELVVRMARAAGWDGLCVRGRDHLRYEVRLHPSPRSGDTSVGDWEARVGPAGSEAAPDAESRAPSRGGSRPEDAAGAPREDISVPAFEPEAVPGRFRFERWEPGNRVEIRKPRLEGGAFAAVLLLVGVFVHLPVAVLAWISVTDRPPMGGVFLVIAAVGTAAADRRIFHRLFTEGRRERSAVLDWSDGTVDIRRGRHRVEASLSSLERLEVRGTRHRNVGDEGPRHEYSVEVWAVLPEGRALLFDTRRGADEEEAYRWGASFAEDVAGHLDAGWRWTGWSAEGGVDLTELLAGGD